MRTESGEMKKAGRITVILLTAILIALVRVRERI